jgi:hypothetical protein
MENHIRQSNLIEDIDNPDEDQQSMLAWEYLIAQPKLTHGVIQRVQKMITINQPLPPNTRGYYRDMAKVNVTVAGRAGAHFAVVPHLMENWRLDHKKLGPLESHIRFEKIHPFIDGNGRTGRMLMWWQEVKMGKEPTLIKFNNRMAYYAWFK